MDIELIFKVELMADKMDIQMNHLQQIEYICNKNDISETIGFFDDDITYAYDYTINISITLIGFWFDT